MQVHSRFLALGLLVTCATYGCDHGPPAQAVAKASDDGGVNKRGSALKPAATKSKAVGSSSSVQHVSLPVSKEHQELRRAYIRARQQRASKAYAIRDDETPTAENPKQQLRVDFQANGVRIELQGKSAPTGTALTLNLRQWGYGERLADVPPVQHREVEGNRVSYHRATEREVAQAPISEWYLNGPLGLEQGFILARRPSERTAAGREAQLQLTLESKGLTPRWSEGFDEIRFEDARGRTVARYSHLYVVDAEKRLLPAKLGLKGQLIVISVDDRNATYPLEIDPVVYTQQKVPSGANYDRIGEAVALSGDTAAVGAPGDDENGTDRGTVHVFLRTAGVWSLQQTLIGKYLADGDAFGTAVALDGDTLVVGAPATASDGGAVYVFTRSAGAWSQQQRIVPADNIAGHNFGSSLGLDNDTFITGAPNHSSKGAAYIYTRSAGSWTQQQLLTAADGAAGDNFGASVSLDADRAAVGAPDDDDKASSSGSAYLFARSAGAWTQEQKLVPADGGINHRFGAGLALDGDTVVVGAPLGLDISAIPTGVAYAYRLSAGTWTLEQKVSAGGANPFDGVGAHVALSGDTVALGSETAGSFVATRSAGVWTHQQKLGNEQSTVAIDSDTVIRGEPSAHQNERGLATAMTRSAATWTVQTTLTELPPFFLLDLVTGLDIDGDKAVICTFDYAYTYNRNGTRWTQGQELNPPASHAALHCALSGDTLVISAHRTAHFYTHTAGGWVLESSHYAGSGGYKSIAGITVDGDWAAASLPENKLLVYNRSAGIWSQRQVLTQPAAHSNRVVSMRNGTMILSRWSGTRVSSPIVYAKSPADVWWEQTELPNPNSSDDFGRLVAADGDTVVVFHNSYKTADARIYTRNGYTWSYIAKRTVTGANGLALRGDRILLGTKLYRRSGSVWTLTHTLHSQSAARVAIGGDTIFVTSNHSGNSAAFSASFYTPGILQPTDPCGADGDCASGECFLGACCGGPCDELCHTCGTGTCTPISGPDTEGSMTCTGTSTCNGSGACLKITGEGCMHASECASGYCADGSCCDRACGVCESCNLPGSAGTCTPDPAGTADPSCGIGSVCDGNGSCIKQLGTACNADAECSSGHCTDGVCCSSACGGLCEVCNSSGSCQATLSGSDPDGDCGSGSVCDGARGCAKTNGQGCTAASECISGFCADGTCCDGACMETCKTCNLTGKLGMCSFVAKGDPDPTATTPCTGAQTCDGAGVCKKAVGETCSSWQDCQNGLCVDGVCCESACSTTCFACSLALNGVDDGLCRPVQAMMEDTHGVPPCTGNKRCDGAATPSCKPLAGGTCTQDSDCSSGLSCADGVCCDTPCKGVCESCVMAGKVGTCSKTAQGSIDSWPPGTCEGSKRCDGNGACLQTEGKTCTANSECLSGFCADGACCKSACDGTCEACNLPGNEGSCKPIPANSDPDNECPGTDAKCAGSCDGKRACAFPDTSARCGLCSLCDGKGACSQTADDDPACGTIDCDGLDTSCRDYDDLDDQRCEAAGKCKAPNDAANCTKFTDTPCDAGPGDAGKDAGVSKDTGVGSDGPGKKDAGTVDSGAKSDTGSSSSSSGGCAVSSTPMGSLPTLLAMLFVVGWTRRRR